MIISVYKNSNPASCEGVRPVQNSTSMDSTTININFGMNDTANTAEMIIKIIVIWKPETLQCRLSLFDFGGSVE